MIIWTRFLTVWMSWGSQIFTDSFSSLQAVGWNSPRSLLIDACKWLWSWQHNSPGIFGWITKLPRTTSLSVIPVIGLSTKWMCGLHYPFPFGGGSCSLGTAWRKRASALCSGVESTFVPAAYLLAISTALFFTAQELESCSCTENANTKGK